jgi:pimeloyl-ACP methyl ester carboxylesterase
MSRHHLISAILAGTALVITGAVFVYFAKSESESVPSSIPREPQPQTDAWVELPCPKELLKLAQVPAHKRKAQCGRLSVPEAEGETRRTVEIGVVRLTPRDGAAKKPLLFLAGGPGDAFSYYLEKRLPAFGALAKGREILIVDQRGTGQGKPLLKCKRELKTREQLDSCFREWRADLDPGSFNTVQSARDLARVLDYHKIDKVAVYGVSYGTRLALAFSELYPARSERVLLDSPVAYVDVLSDAAKNAQAALTRVLSACHDEARCKAAFPTSFDGLITLVEAMDREGDGSAASNSGNDFLYALSKLSLHPGVLPYVPYLIERARQGDQELPNKLREASSSYQSSLGLHLSVQCAEFFAHTSPAAIRKGEEGVNPAFRRAFSTASYEDQCADWAVPPLPPPRAPENLDVPVLVVSGAFDPVTPPEYGALLQKALPRSRHVTIRSVAHGAVLSACGALVGSGFMEGGLDASLPSCVDAKLTFETGPPDETRLQQILHEIRYRL